jgi:N utilization substance protein A
VNIDVTALKAVEREKGIPADTVIEAIEQALVTAYRHADGAAKHVRVHVDRKTGEVAVLAQELGPDGEVVREWDDTPSDFGRIAASTAKQVIVQRLRDAEHEQTFGEYAGKEGDIVSGIVQADQRRNAGGTVLVDIGKVEAVLPPTEQVPGENYAHGSRLRAYVVSVARTFRGPQVTVSRTHPNLVRKLFALEVPEIADGSVEIVAVAREAGHRVACAQLRHLNPLPRNTGDVLRSFERVLVPELNSGQLAMLLRSRFLVDIESHSKVRGQPLYAEEIAEQIALRQ